MEQVLIKYKSVEDYSINGFIKAVYTDIPFETLRILKEVEDITIDGECYEYISSTYRVPEFEGMLDVITVYVNQEV